MVTLHWAEHVCLSSRHETFIADEIKELQTKTHTYTQPWFIEAHSADTTHYRWCQEIRLAWAITHQTHTHIVVWRQGQHIISQYMRVLVSEHVRTYCKRGYKCLSSQHALWDGIRTAGRPVSVTDCSWSKLALPAWPSPMGCVHSLKVSCTKTRECLKSSLKKQKTLRDHTLGKLHYTQQ